MELLQLARQHNTTNTTYNNTNSTSSDQPWLLVYRYFNPDTDPGPDYKAAATADRLLLKLGGGGVGWRGGGSNNTNSTPPHRSPPSPAQPLQQRSGFAVALTRALTNALTNALINALD